MVINDLNHFSKQKKPNHRWFKSAFFVVALTIAIYSVKLLLQPIGQVLGSFWENSTSTVTRMLTGPRSLKKDEDVTNFLLVGIDRRSRSEDSFLTDTIIIASFNHKTQKSTLLSLPRDLWVEIPGFNGLPKQYSKINSAHALGDQFDYPGGGMQLLSDILEEILGIPIHYYARIDFEGFEKGIDAVGGIEIFVDTAFDDYMYPRAGYEDFPWEERFEHVHFDEGLQHMDGEMALKFARSRHALGPEGTDFARARRQQKVLLAVKNKVLSTETLLDFGKLRELYFALTENVAANVEVAELPLFFNLTQNLQTQKIETFVLDGNDGPGGVLYSPQDIENYGGAWVLLPKAGDFSKVQKFVREIFY